MMARRELPAVLHAPGRQAGKTAPVRSAHVDQGPFGAREVEDSPDALRTLWVRGSFPDSCLAAGDRLSAEWRKDFIRICLEREIPQSGPRIPALTLDACGHAGP